VFRQTRAVEIPSSTIEPPRASNDPRLETMEVFCFDSKSSLVEI